MKLYYLRGACSIVPHTALQWIGKPYQAEAATHETIKSPEYLRLNPQGAVPVLIDGDFVLTQNVAILSYLDQLNPQAKIFGSNEPQAHARAVRWLSFCNSDLHPLFGPLFHPEGLAGDNPEFIKEIQKNATAKILNLLAKANEHLANQPYLGDSLSVADVYLYVELRWCKGMKVDFSALEHLEAFYQRVEANQGVQEVLKQQGLK